MNGKFSKTLLPCLLLTSCANLQQAPLLYSSKSTVGLDISSSTTESPGGSISFGVKLVDAAYVPVAVSKRISYGKAYDTNREIQKIEAVFGRGTTESGRDGLTDENKRKISEYLAAKMKEEQLARQLAGIKKERTALEADIDSAERRIIDLEAGIASAKASLDPEADADLDVDVDVTAQQTELEKLQEENVGRKRQVKAIVTDELETQVQQAAQVSSKLFDEAAEAASFLRTDKRDAMSVYGRFDSESKAAIGSTTGGLTAGKIFSTGVASQNLTEAARYGVIYTSVADCVAKMTNAYSTASSPTDKTKVLDMMNKLCDPESLRKLESDK